MQCCNAYAFQTDENHRSRMVFKVSTAAGTVQAVARRP